MARRPELGQGIAKSAAGCKPGSRRRAANNTPKKVATTTTRDACHYIMDFSGSKAISIIRSMMVRLSSVTSTVSPGNSE